MSNRNARVRCQKSRDADEGSFQVGQAVLLSLVSIQRVDLYLSSPLFNLFSSSVQVGIH